MRGRVWACAWTCLGIVHCPCKLEIGVPYSMVSVAYRPVDGYLFPFIVLISSHRVDLMTCGVWTDVSFSPYSLVTSFISQGHCVTGGCSRLFNGVFVSDNNRIRELHFYIPLSK